MLKSTLRGVLVALVLSTFMLSASPAFAATAEWKSVDVTLQTGDQGQSELIVSATLPGTASLPAEAEIAVPAGTGMRWIGEILGGPVAEDPSLQYTKTVVSGMDVYRFTLTKSRIAQFEGDASGSSVVSGATHTTRLTWTAWRKLSEVRLRERLPQGAQVVQDADGAALEAGETGVFYARTFKRPKAGQVLDLNFAYTAPAPTPALATGSTSGADSGSAAVTLVVALVAMGCGMLLMTLLQKASRKPAPLAAAKAGAVTMRESPTARNSAAAAAAAADSSSAEPAEPRTPMRPRLAIAVVLGVLTIAVAAAVALSTATPIVDGKITKFFGSASPCQNVTIPVVANEGVDLTRHGIRLVDAFAGQDGVGDVTLDVARSVMEVGFCESSQSEESVRRIIAGTGLVSLGASAVPGGGQ